MKQLISCCLAFLSSIYIFAEPSYQPTEQNLLAREWFQDSKFGLFIVWGPYSVLENGEWVLEITNLTLHEYNKKAVSKFNPKAFDPSSWVALAKEAGMKYITITSKHHDGFAMWNTKQNHWSVMMTPFKKDPLKALAEECHRQGVKLFLYYSHLDWYHPDYFPFGMTGHHTGRTVTGNFNRYLNHMDAQLCELLTGYGPIAGIWFDGMWDKPGADWRLKQTYSLIHQLQPAALVGNNHHLLPFEGEDFQMFEQDLPGQCTLNFQNTVVSTSLPLEMCQTINDTWGYSHRDKNFKSTKELIHLLVKAAGHNANFLLDVGPRADGTIQSECVERLQDIGKWMRTNGETIYGTREGPVKPMSWGVTTQKGNKIYLHLLNWEQESLPIPLIKNVVKASFWSTGSQVDFVEKNNSLTLRIPEHLIDETDTIIELEIGNS